MADMTRIKGRIAETIYPNGTGAITAESHQALLLEMVDDINAKKADKEEVTTVSAETIALRGFTISSSSSSLQYVTLPVILKAGQKVTLRLLEGAGVITIYSKESDNSSYVTQGKISADSPIIPLNTNSAIAIIGIYSPDSANGAVVMIESEAGSIMHLTEQALPSAKIVSEAFDVLPKLPQLFDVSAFMKDKRPNQAYGAGINDINDDANWTTSNAIFFGDGKTRTLATNMSGSTFYLATYERNGDKYTRTGTIINGSSWTQVGDHYEYTLNNNIFVAVRCWIVTSNLPTEPKMTLAEEWEGSSAEYRPKEVVVLKPEVKNDAAPWAGKKIVGIGDSIVVGVDANGTPIGEQGMQINSAGGWLAAIKEKYPSVTTLNMGVASTTMAKNNNVPANASYGCILDRMDSIPDGYDYILLAGGVNDFFHKDTYSIPFGDDTTFLYDTPISAKYENGAYSALTYMMQYGGGHTGDLDATTFCGAMEIAMVKLVTRFHDKKIGFIINHRIRPTKDFNQYMDYAKKMCEKYGVPCLDLREVVCMPRIYGIAGNSNGTSIYTVDAVHPNDKGYKEKYLPAIEAWMRTL
jgi:lysophospholipase L1-like esterase